MLFFIKKKKIFLFIHFQERTKRFPSDFIPFSQFFVPISLHTETVRLHKPTHNLKNKMCSLIKGKILSSPMSLQALFFFIYIRFNFYIQWFFFPTLIWMKKNWKNEMKQNFLAPFFPSDFVSFGFIFCESSFCLFMSRPDFVMQNNDGRRKSFVFVAENFYSFLCIVPTRICKYGKNSPFVGIVFLISPNPPSARHESICISILKILSV